MNVCIGSRGWVVVLLAVASGCSSKAAIPCSDQSTCAPYHAVCIDSICQLPPVNVSDLGVPDLATRADLASSVDLAMSEDLATPVDLAMPPDLALSCASGQACPTAEPICGSNQICRACVAADHAACTSANVLTPRCDETAGTCAACRPAEASDCPDTAASVCSSDGSCRQSCTAHSDCASGICDFGILTPGVNSCARASEVVYVQGVTTCGAAPTGSSTDPLCTLDAAFAKLPNGGFIKVLSGATLGRATTTLTQPYVIVGSGSVTAPSTTMGTITLNHSAFLVGAGGRVYIEGLTASVGGGGFSCDAGSGSASMTLEHVWVGSMTGAGIASTGCTLSVDRSYVGASGGGIDLDGGSLTRLTNTALVDNSNVAVYVSATTTVDPSLVGFLTILRNTPTATSVPGAFTCNAAMNIHDSLVWGNQAVSGKSYAGSCSFTNSSVDPAVSGTTNNNVAPSIKKVGNRYEWHLDGDAGNNDTCCVNKAVPIAGVVVDYDGQARPDGPAPDIGADEI